MCVSGGEHGKKQYTHTFLEEVCAIKLDVQWKFRFRLRKKKTILFDSITFSFVGMEGKKLL